MHRARGRRLLLSLRPEDPADLRGAAGRWFELRKLVSQIEIVRTGAGGWKNLHALFAPTHARPFVVAVPADVQFCRYNQI